MHQELGPALAHSSCGSSLAQGLWLPCTLQSQAARRKAEQGRGLACVLHSPFCIMEPPGQFCLLIKSVLSTFKEKGYAVAISSVINLHCCRFSKPSYYHFNASKNLEVDVGRAGHLVSERRKCFLKSGQPSLPGPEEHAQEVNLLMPISVPAVALAVPCVPVSLVWP